MIGTLTSCIFPEFHCLQGSQHPFATQFTHGLQDIHQHHKCLRQVTVDHGAAAIQQPGELGSALAKALLDDWDASRRRFLRVRPRLLVEREAQVGAVAK